MRFKKLSNFIFKAIKMFQKVFLISKDIWNFLTQTSVIAWQFYFNLMEYSRKFLFKSKFSSRWNPCTKVVPFFPVLSRKPTRCTHTFPSKLMIFQRASVLVNQFIQINAESRWNFELKVGFEAFQALVGLPAALSTQNFRESSSK